VVPGGAPDRVREIRETSPAMNWFWLLNRQTKVLKAEEDRVMVKLVEADKLN
jgi:hypothetical protein